MARTNAISLLTGDNAPASLAEIYGLVIENVQKGALSAALKSNQYTGNPAAGSVEFTRFVNSTSKDYGTARAAAKGDKVKAPKVTVNLDQHKEIVEEVAKFDIDTFGVSDVMRRRADNHTVSMMTTLDRAFFAQAAEAGQAFTAKKTAIQDIVEEMIQAIENTHNDHVDGVDRDAIRIVLTPAKYGELRTFLDTQANPNVDTAGEEFGMYHGVRVYSSTRLPVTTADAGSGKTKTKTTNAIAMINGAVAQPVVSDQYGAPEKIPLSNDYDVSLFYDYGTKALTPDLIQVWSTEATA
jgi:hypothetical protein